MVKLVVQIPCFNEQDALPATLAQLPREIAGIDTVEWLIVDDGSTDDTVRVAREHGAENVVSLARNMGLARAFMVGLEESLKRGADIVVNLDADNQYNAGDIERLVRPILTGEADYVIGARPIAEIAHFSWLTKTLQRIGSWTVRLLSGLEIGDAPSGFRALSRDAAYRLNVFNEFTYTLETLIQAGNSNIRTVSVPVRVNDTTRPSRLFGSVSEYVVRSVGTILRFFILYRAFPFLLLIAIVLFSCGFLLGVRFLILNFVYGESGHVQSVMLAVLLMSIGFMTGLTGILADLISVNRRLLEQVKHISRRMEHRLTDIEERNRP